jgi:hypothetical protein
MPKTESGNSEYRLFNRCCDEEATVSEHMLHLQSPDRWDDMAAIVGDRTALEALRNAVEAALCTGAGGAFLFSSDGEGYALAVALEENMWDVQTAYAGEMDPVRSLREVVPIREVENFQSALHHALRMRDQFSRAPGQDCRRTELQPLLPTAARPLAGQSGIGAGDGK